MAFNLGQNAYNLQSWQSSSPGIMGNWTVVDKVPVEMMSLIDPHWYQFPPSKISKQFSCELLNKDASGNIFSLQ